MILSDISVERPIFASVISLLLVAFGLLSFLELPLREYPDSDPPIINVETRYVGAAPALIESQITRQVEDAVSGIEGIRTISSVSRNGESQVSLEFSTSRNIDDAANDVRDSVSRISDDLPDEADLPEIFKVDADNEVIMWFNLSAEGKSGLEITDYADRFIVDRFSVLDGVARVRIGGERRYAMRIWLDPLKLAAYQLTIDDIENSLRAQNIELPAGRLESSATDMTLRLERTYLREHDFRNLIIRRGDDGHLLRLGEVARIEIEAEQWRNTLRGNGKEMVGLGIIKQSNANTLEVARLARAAAEEINKTLPAGMQIKMSFDSSVFIEASVHEVYLTLAIGIFLVVAVILLFLGDWRSTLIPSLTVPVSLIASFIFLYAAGFSINLITLLALILAIGLVVDDSIVVLENIFRRIELGEHPIIGSYYGAREVGFAVIATTLVLIAVFAPITFAEGKIGRIFTEFALAMSAAVAFSSIVALTLTPMLCSKLLRHQPKPSPFKIRLERFFEKLGKRYVKYLDYFLFRKWLSIIIVAIAAGATFIMLQFIEQEFSPKEDRGVFFINVNAKEGTSYQQMLEYMKKIEKDMLPLVESKEAIRALVRVPRSFGGGGEYNTGLGIVVLEDWGNRRSAFDIVKEIQEKLNQHPEVQAFTIMRSGMGGGNQRPVQFVLQGGEYAELAKWRDIIMGAARENKGLVNPDSDYKETRPHGLITIDQTRAGDLGISSRNIARTLETMLASRQVTQYQQNGEEYDVILEAEDKLMQNPDDLSMIYLRSETTGELVSLANLVKFSEYADATELNRFNRLRAITIQTGLADDYTLGEALDFLEETAREKLPAHAKFDFKGESREYKDSGQQMLFIFGLCLIIIFLVLAAQFESWILPLVILLTVPFATTGAFAAMLISGQTINVFSQIGLLMLIGLAAKNGILIVEFAGQIRDRGVEMMAALREACAIRLRPILMTSVTTIFGAIPLIITSGAGAETRFVLGVVIVGGVLLSTILTLFVLPVIYSMLAKNIRPIGEIRRIREEMTITNEDVGF